MDDTKKNDAPKPTGGAGARPGQGSGSDTVSAAKIAGGAPGGAPVQSPRPQGATGGAQSSTLASQSSRPLGSPSPTPAPRPAPSAQGGSPGQGGSGDKGLSDTLNTATEQAKQTAQAAGETLREVAGEAQERAGEAYEQASEWARDKYEQASSWASDQYEYGSRHFEGSGQRVMNARHGVERFVAQNPVLVGVIGLAAGLLLGSLLPRTRQEDRTLGRWSDEVRDQGLRYARDMTQRGREYVQDALSDEDAQFSSPGRDRGRDQGRDQGQRTGPSGRIQNH